MDAKTDDSAGKCPFTGGTHGPRNRDWWPEHLDIGVLRTNAPAADPIYTNIGRRNGPSIGLRYDATNYAALKLHANGSAAAR